LAWNGEIFPISFTFIANIVLPQSFWVVAETVIHPKKRFNRSCKKRWCDYLVVPVVVFASVIFAMGIKNKEVIEKSLTLTEKTNTKL